MPKVPRSEAVSILCPEGRYQETMREIRSSVALDSLGIGDLKVKRALTGALTYEVWGEESGPKADAVAARIEEVVGGRPGYRVSRPYKTAEIRILGIDVATEPAELKVALALAGECPPSRIILGEIRETQRGGASAWARCPLSAVDKIAGGKGVKIGWTRAKVEVLEGRLLQCFRCHALGHVMAHCRRIDRREACYRCGEMGHFANRCGPPGPGCAACRAAGRPSTHRTGGKGCKAPRIGPRSAAAAGKGRSELPGVKDGPPYVRAAEETSVMEVDPQRGERRKGTPSSDHEEEQAPVKKKKEEDGGKDTPAGKEGAEDAGDSRDIHPPA